MTTIKTTKELKMNPWHPPTFVVTSAIRRASTSPIDFDHRSKRKMLVEPAASSSLALIFNASVSSNFISSVKSPIPTLFSHGLDLAISLSLPQNFLTSRIVRDSWIGYW